MTYDVLKYCLFFSPLEPRFSSSLDSYIFKALIFVFLRHFKRVAVVSVSLPFFLQWSQFFVVVFDGILNSNSVLLHLRNKSSLPTISCVISHSALTLDLWFRYSFLRISRLANCFLELAWLSPFVDFWCTTWLLFFAHFKITKCRCVLTCFV